MYVFALFFSFSFLRKYVHSTVTLFSLCGQRRCLSTLFCCVFVFLWIQPKNLKDSELQHSQYIFLPCVENHVCMGSVNSVAILKNSVGWLIVLRNSYFAAEHVKHLCSA